MIIDGLEFDDSLGTYEIRRDGRVIGDLLWGINPNDRARFGWLLHVIHDPEAEPTAVIRVGDSDAQDALWETRGDRSQWNALATLTEEATRESALRDTARLLNLGSKLSASSN
jgi:hypothetical protein